MARKPLTGTVAANVERYGTGALNIDGTRIGAEGGIGYVQPRPTSDADGPSWGKGEHVPFHYADSKAPRAGTTSASTDGASGKWPPNLLLTDPIFDGDTPGVVGGGEANPGAIRPYVRSHDGPVDFGRGDGEPSRYDRGPDAGTYSRFFLIPKASRADREPVLRNGVPKGQRITTHPTVKPVRLMRHLVRLVTPPAGLVLDPFLGSGTTALAAEAEGFRWVGIELDPESVSIAEARLDGWQRGLGLADEVPA
jgi:site-specific DNA-methyltransferase (adenine-specific)